MKWKNKLKHEAPASKKVNAMGATRTKAWVDRKEQNENSNQAVRDRWKGKR